MSISRRLWKSIEGALFAAGAVVVFGTLGLVLAALLPSLPGYESLIVYGGSMAPFLQNGDVAVIQPIRPEDLRVGDVVTYRSGTDRQSAVTHRITDIKAQDGVLAFETKGDANGNVDYWGVADDTVVGRVIYKVPFVGYLFHFGKGLPGRLLLVGLPAFLLVIETSRRKRPRPSLDDRLICKVDDQTERQEVIPEAILAKAPAVLANHPELLASSGGVAVHGKRVDQTGQRVSGTRGWIGPMPQYHGQWSTISEEDPWFIARHVGLHSRRSVFEPSKDHLKARCKQAVSGQAERVGI